MTEIKKFLKGLLGGILALIVLCVIVTAVTFITRDPARSTAGWDPVSYIQHFAAVPAFWMDVLVSFLLVLLVFSIGFYLGIRKITP